MGKGDASVSDITTGGILRRVVDLCREMLELADHGDRFREDAQCGVVYGILRDEGYKIRRLAEHELLNHDSKEDLSSPEGGTE